MGRRASLIAAVLAMGLIAAGCSSSNGNGSKQTGSSSKVKEGGTLRLGTNSRIDSLNPFVAFNQDSFTMFEYIYPYLVQYDTRTLQFAGDFATKWETSPDGHTWTFHTVPNAQWSDGQPLTANDAAWTIKTVLKYAKGSTAAAANYLTHLTGADAPDPTTLIIHYQTAIANGLSQLQQLAILPQHVWSRYATGDGGQLKSFKNQAPIV